MLITLPFYEKRTTVRISKEVIGIKTFCIVAPPITSLEMVIPVSRFAYFVLKCMRLLTADGKD